MFDPGLMDMVMRLRSRGIFDTDVLRAIELTPRKYFVRDGDWAKAYEDLALPIDCGQSISDPHVIAMMSQALEARPEHKILEVGTGSGYHAAILSRLGKRVYSIERYQKLLDIAQNRFKKLDIVNVVTRHGDGRFGWQGQAPFNRIMVTCGLKTKPKKLLSQLAEEGVLVAVIKGELHKFTKAGDDLTLEKILPIDLPLAEPGKSQAL